MNANDPNVALLEIEQSRIVAELDELLALTRTMRAASTPRPRVSG